ncbi:MAG: acyl-CoA desaturase [Pseudomonadota bacterium]
MTVADNIDTGLSRKKRPGSETFPEGITVEHDAFKPIQKIHAILIAVVPLVGTLVALWMAFTVGVSWLDLSLFLILYVFTIFGISVGYHRLFSHRAFKAKTSVRVALAIAGSMAAQGSVVYWVSNHRRHHQYTDVLGDIHSPIVNDEREMGYWEGFWHSHMGWTFDHKMTNALKFAKDLYRDQAVARANRLYYVWVFLGLALPAVIGGLVTMTWMGAFTAFLWGGLVRMFLSYHTVNGIDSITHLFGSQPFKSEDHSRNNPLWAFLTLGEGWHNNHHAFPSSAVFGLEWYQLDPGTWLLRGLEKLGLVWDIQRPTDSMIEAKRA